MEIASPAHFIPELPGWRERSLFIERMGSVSYYHYDPYSQALAKIERGHAKDLDDVAQLLARGLVEPQRLRELFEGIVSRLHRYPAVDPAVVQEALGRRAAPEAFAARVSSATAIAARGRRAVGYEDARLRRLNDKKIATGGDYVLYWMQLYRRLDHNHALDYALRCAAELGRPLVVYEGLRLDYPWASRRLHRFILEGMEANAERARRSWASTTGPTWRPPAEPAQGLLPGLAARACLVVTDDFPCFIVPGQSAALARRAEVPVFAVDSNSLVPLSLLGPPVGAAAPPAAADPQGLRRGLGPSRGREAADSTAAARSR